MVLYNSFQMLEVTTKVIVFGLMLRKSNLNKKWVTGIMNLDLNPLI